MADSSDLEKRVARLERENRRFRVAAAATAVAAGALLIAAAKPAPRQRLVTATELRLIDPTGAIRGTMSADRTGAQLLLKDTGGKSRARLRVADDGTPRFELLDRMERVRLGLALDHDGAATAQLEDDAGHARVRLATAADGSAHVEVSDGTKKRAALDMDADGTAGAAVFDGDGTARVRSGLSGDGAPAVKLIDADGTLRASLGTIALKEANSGASLHTQEGSLVLLDKKGGVVFKQPR
ncbi:MAG TPA: hypothetical protein VG777_05925 [Thermoanaerobaculia bacterium]|nr:hypothetical protein [Thermoanaerobaculia bacterium]